MKNLIQKLAIVFASICSVSAHINDYIRIPGLRLASFDELNYRILKIDSFYDFLWANLYVGAFYYALYLGLGTVLESTNPAPKTEYRKIMTKKEIKLGLSALFSVILFTTFWMWKLEHLTPYYGYYEQHHFGVKEFFISLVIYMFAFDLWFFSTHVAMHHHFFWHYIHNVHHQFIEPSAFGQDAVHPLESLLQGPVGHFALTLLWPQQPVFHSIFGFLTGLYAIFAHDGRWDPTEHNKHHFYTSCNFGLFGFFDYVFRTKYSKEKYPIEYVPTWIRNQNPKKYIE